MAQQHYLGAAPHSQAAILRVNDLGKTYAGATKPAVDGVTFSIAPGEIVGLLGTNGAGKSTLIAMLTTRLPPSRGEIRIGSVSSTQQPEVARAYLGVAGQSNTLDGSCTVIENLYLHCRYHGLSRSEARAQAESTLDELGLASKRDAMPEALSGGLVRRLQLGRAMAHNPALLLLDEPTNELDVPNRALFWERLHRTRTKQQTAVLLATHLLDEAEEHCDRVLIMDSGRIVAEGRPSELRRRFRGTRTLELWLAHPLCAATHTAIEALDGVVRCIPDGHRVSVLLDVEEVPLHAVARLLGSLGVLEVATRTATLREIFLDVVRSNNAEA